MHYDIIIIGSGPAGLAAGLYAARGQMLSLIHIWERTSEEEVR